ncbi:MAG TPA: hypothetical protein PLE45_09500 [Spirochaetota bacterium]|nr:hypothetical protein [Spirochaetota bacterium]HOL57368.1 hypothetical protein [Spirochaetota bacterium]HPP04707.1 hypothetical protein [Spirochaetota bacterium]
MSVKKNIFLIFFFLLISCSSVFYIGKKRDFYICSNIEYNNLFDDYKRAESLLIKYFNRNFYNVKVKRIASFSGFLQEFSDIANKDKDAVIFVNDFLIGHILSNKDIFSKNKIITYNSKDLNNEFLSIFNIYIDSNLIAKKILNLIKKEKRKKDYSDVLMIINTNYQIPKEVRDIIKNKNLKITFLEENLESNVSKYLEKEKDNFNVVILFGYNLNKVLIDITKKENEKSKLLKIKYIEVFSNYLEALNLNGYSINLNFENLIKAGINSRSFNKFLKQKDTKSYDLKISNDSNILRLSKRVRFSPLFVSGKNDPTSD